MNAKIKSWALLLIGFLSVFNVMTASAEVTLNGPSKVCPGSAILLNSFRTNSAHYVMLQKKSGSTWVNVLSGMTKNTSYVCNMESSDMTFRLVEYGNDNLTPYDYSTELTVGVQTDKCPKLCHQTSTGEYFNGTDFDVLKPQAGTTTYKPAIPSEIVSFFGDGDAPVYFTSLNNSGYSVKTDISSYLGKTPALKDLSTNYYYTYDNFGGTNQPFEFCFPYWTWKDKNYRFIMRFYLIYTCNDGEIPSALLKLETPQGNFGTQKVNVKVYDEDIDSKTPFSNTTTEDESFGHAKLNIQGHAGHLLRVDATFYGTFPHTGQGWNNNSDFCMKPQFQQMGGNCMKIAIDYISAEMESVCMDHGAVCSGDSTTVNAAGFPLDANYTWEKYTNGSWVMITSGKDKQSVILKAEGVNLTQKYRVSDSNTPDVSVEFEITSMDCAPSYPEDINGDDQLCIPAMTESYVPVYTVTPSDDSPNVTYGWTLKRGSEILAKIGDGATLENTHTEILDRSTNSDGQYKSVKVKLPDNAQEGDYTLTVQLYKEHAPQGSTVTKTIKVYKKPTPSLSIAEPVCPFTENFVTVSPNDPAKYEYEYGWGDVATTTPNVGKIVFDEAAKCSLVDMIVAARVKVKAMPTCYADAVNYAVSVNNSEPEIDCDKLHTDFATSGYNSITLPATSSSATVTLPMPTILSTCDPNPTISIVGSGKYADGTDYSFSLTKKKKEITVADLTVSLKATTNATGTNGLTFTYSVTDGCNRTSETCFGIVVVRDVTAPFIDCSKIKSYEGVKLSLQKNCVAVPGYNAELPLLAAPVLADKNGVDGTIEGQYMGRLENPTTVPVAEAASEGKFTNTELNDPYVAGVTYILWKFVDKAGNASYCLQHVSVLNDKAPVVTCPSNDYGKFSVDDKCKLSFETLFPKLPPLMLPTAVDPCPNGATNFTVKNAKLWYREAGSVAWIEIDDAKYKEDLFKLNHSYELQWRYYKQGESAGVDKSVFGECVASIEIVDSVPPVVDCSSLKDIAVPLNSNSKKLREFNYASAKLPSTETPDNTEVPLNPGKVNDDFNVYTLADFFEDFSIPSATDACNGTIDPAVTITFGETTTPITGTKAQIVDKLKDYKFLEGTSYIRYTYTDNAGNTSFCEQAIMVYSGLFANCPAPVTLTADENCKAVYDLKPSDVSKALVSYIREFKRKGNPPYTKATDPVQLVKSEEGYKGLSLSSDSMAADKSNKKVEVYPLWISKVTNVTAAGVETANSVTTKVENGSALTSHPYKVVGHMWYNDAPGHKRWEPLNDPKNIQVWESLELKTKPFTTAELSKPFLTFDKGIHKLVFHYENGMTGDNKEVKECEVIIKVEDKTPPTVDCGNWGKNYKIFADESCFNDTLIKVPTPTELKVKDNCSKTDADFDVTYVRDYYKDGYSIFVKPTTSNQKIDAPYGLGETVIVWTIADADKNATTCTTRVEVLDTIGPKFDCGTLKDIKVNADPADPLCRISAADVVAKGGLTTPRTPNNDCTPVLDASGNEVDYIYATGVRQGEEDVDVFAGYYAGTTTIIWTFKDGALGVTTCKQNVIVSDNTPPNLTCEPATINRTLASDKCEVEASDIVLKQPVIEDNCTKGDENFDVSYERTFNKKVVADHDLPYPIGTTTIKWIVVDESNNRATCTQNIVVKDTAVPKGPCPADIDVKAPLNSCEATVAINPSDYKLHDECDKKDLTPVFVSRSDSKKLTDPYPVGATTIRWKYTDASKNVRYCNQVVTVHDVTPPVPDCANTDVYTEAKPLVVPTKPGECTLSPADLVDKVNLPTAEDECYPGAENITMVGHRYYKGLDGKQTATLVTDIADQPIEWDDIDNPYEPGYYDIIFTFYDPEGNHASCTLKLFVKDNNNPVINCKNFVSNKTFNPLEDQCSRDITKSMLGAKTTVKATEFCRPEVKIDGVPYLYSGGKRSKTVFASQNVSSSKSITIHWVFTSATGVEYVCPQTVTVKDNQGPKCEDFTMTAHTDYMAEPTCSVDTTAYLIDINATDNCGGDIKYEYKLDDETEYKEATEDVLLEGLAVGSHTVVWQLTDQYSNKRPAACKTTIVVEDNTLPTCTGDVLENVPTLVDAVTCDATVSLPLPIGAADNCSDNTLSYRYKVGKTGDYTDINKTTNITLPVGKNTIYWEMSDGINTHAEACSTVVTVLDKTAPYCDDLDMGKIKSDETDCNTDVLIELASGAKDYCNSKITYKYSVDGKELKTVSAAPTLNLEVGTHEIVWTLADAKGNSRPDACKTTVTILGNQKLEPDCNTIAPHLYDTIKTCGPSTTVKIQAPTFTDPCYDDYIIKGTTKDNIKSFPLGNTVVTWTFTNKDKTQTAECQQTVSVVTSQKLQFECPKDTVKLALNADECVKEYTLVPKTAEEPCTGRELMGSAYINGKLVKPANYKRDFPAGLTEIVWVFVGDANILAKPKDTCKQYVKVGNDNRPPVPCKNDKVSLTLDEGCDVLPTELDLGNEGVILADELCVAGKKVTPNIWRTSNPENVVHDPADLGVYHPGKDTVMWHYQFNPSNLGNIMDVYCVQPIEIFTDSKIKLDCNDESFAKLTFETPANTCQVPGDTVTLNPVDAVHPCFDDVIIEGKTDHDFTKPYPLGTTTITWVYTDHTWTLTDSVAQCTQLIEVIDKTKPTIVCDKDSLYYLPRDEKGQEALCAAPFADLDIKKPEVSDNCSSADEDFTISYVRKYTDEKGNSKTTAAEDPFEVGTTVITWTVLDKATNKSTCQQTIIVKDSITPKPTCPEDLTLEAPEGKCDTTIAVVVGETYKYEDPCEGDIIPVGVRDDGKEIGDPFPVMKLVTITWTYTDSHNNSSQCTQTVFVKDMTKPEVDCENTATPIKVKTELEKCEVDGEVVVDKITLPTAKDLCQEEAPVMTSSRYYLGRDGLAAPAIVLNEGDTVRWDDKTVPFKAGYYEIHFIFTDKAGNSDSCVQSVFVEDINPPVTDECKDVPTPVVLTPALGECDVNIVPTELNTYQAKEFCTDDMIDGVPALLVDDEISAKPIPSTLTSGDSIIIRWTYTSQMGYTAVCDQKIKAIDNQKPDVDCSLIKDTTMTASADKCEISAEDANIQAPVVDDNCGPITGRPERYDYDYTANDWVLSEKTMTDPFPTGKTLIRWYFEDTNPENTLYCDQVVFVKGSIAPEIDCDTFKTFFDTVPGCETRSVVLRVPSAIDKCAPEELKEVVGVPTRSDGKDINDPFPLGNTIVTWTFTDFTNSISSSCNDTVNVRTKLDLIKACVEDTAVNVEEGECFKRVSMKVPVAEHPCFETVTDTAVPFLNKTNLSAYVVGDSLIYNYPVGKHTIHWVFTDTTESLVYPVDTCTTHLQIGNINQMPVDCDNYPALDTVLKGVCSIPASAFNFNDPEVIDLCTNQTIIPDIYLTSDPENIVHDANLLGEFKVGVRDTIVRVFEFKSEGQDISTSIECRQPVWVRDSGNIKVQCLPDDSITTLIAHGVCELPMEDVLDSLGTPEATDICIDHTIPGVPMMTDGSKLPTSIKVGDTLTVMWMFNDSLANADTVYCFQKVTAISDMKPIFNDCDSVKATELTFIAENACEYTFNEGDFTAPVATDACTGLPYPANGYFKSNNKPIIGTTLSVGNDTIVWVFTTPTTTASDTCEQPIKVRTDSVPLFDCSTLGFLDDTISGKCEAPMSDILAKIGNPEAVEQCTGTKIPGVPTLVNGDPLPETLAVGDTITIRWTFALPDYTIGVKTCDQGVTVTGDGKPLFECESLEPLSFVAEGECTIDLDERNIPVPVAKDSCKNTDVPATGVRSDGGELFGTYPLGITTITWTFKSPYSKTPRICEQTVEVKTDKEIDGKCGEENYPTLSFNVKDYKCTVPGDSIVKKLSAHEALNPCDETVIINGVPTRSDNEEMDAPYPIGQTIITWTFTDVTNTLVTPVSTCEQIVTVTDENDPMIDCPTAFPDSTLYLEDGNCTFDFSAIPVHLEIPVNPCNNEQAVVDTVRSSGLAMNAPFAVGKDTITWTLTFESTNRSATCKQAIEVLDTIAPKFDCSELKDTIVVALSKDDAVPFEDVQAAGFYIPTVTDVCSEVTTVVTREDGKEYTDDYTLGNTTVIFQFSDIYNNTKTCSQVVKVVDMIPPVLTCPELHKTIACAGDTSTTYTSFEEFVAAGGSIDEPSKIKAEAFGHKDVIDGDYCNAVITRNYYVLTIREDSIWCQNPQTFNVKDTIKPEYVGIPAEGLTMVTSCDVADTVPPVVTASDNCDPSPAVTMTRVSTQGDDPSKCDYYTYDVTYTWVATDRCGNAADPVTYTVHVKDTVAPEVHAPKDWNVALHPVLRGMCIFLVPDITGLIPSDSIMQNCGSNEYIKFWQEPEAGTRVTESTVIKLHIEDVCGNDTVLEKKLTVQKREDIVNVVALDKDICADEDALRDPRGAANSLSSDEIAYSDGRIWITDFDGSWIRVRTNVLWDFFRGSISDSTVVYSNNDMTYGKRFADAEPLDSAGNAAYARYNLLLRQSQSDTYYFVATDSVSGCSDTAHAYLNVLEKPRVKIESGEWSVCDGDSIPVSGGFAAMFNPCINDMGSPILEEGWMLNGEPYTPGAEILYADGSKLIAAYYATNVCGMTTTLKSLYVSCDGDLPTRADSLVVAGSLANLGLMAEDKLYISDSVKVNVFTHYEPSQVLVTTYPQDKARIWEGDMAQLIYTSPYGQPAVYEWKKVVGEFDAEQGAIYDKEGNLIEGGSGEDDDEVLPNVWAADDTMYLHYSNRISVMPTDSSFYYVVVGNGVCPTVSSNLVSIDVLHRLPTAITPYDKDGMNDDFMRGHRVAIFNRYGQLIYEGNNGWDGTYRGLYADPGVYYYEVYMAGGTVRKGAIEVVKIR